MAGACSVPDFWRTTGSLVVVRGPPLVRQRRWIYGAFAVLFFTGNHPRHSALVCATGDWRCVGNLRNHFHGDRRSPYLVRSARSCAVELAEDLAAGNLSGSRDRITIFFAGGSSHGASADVLRSPHTPSGGGSDLVFGLRCGLVVVVCVLFLSRGNSLAGIASC